MKKIISVFLIMLLLVITLPACSSGSKTFELALITDVGTINDKSFNQGAWEGLEKYAKEFKKTYKYYQPSEKTTDAYVAAITLAVNTGAEVIVTPGYLFEEAIFKAQDLFPEVSFILLDGFPHNADYTEFRIENNVHSIFYAEEEVGFLAGYVAIKEGFRKLGFMGGMAVPAVIRFGYGFIQGAEYAAEEIGLGAGSVELKYTYLGNFNEDPAHQTKAASWFNSGTEVIFAGAGGAGNSVMAAAEEQKKKVIGVDVDQHSESDTVIISAMKSLSLSVYEALEDYYAGSFKGGVSVTLDIRVDGVGLSDRYTRLKNFTKSDYESIKAMLVADTNGIRTNILKDTDSSGSSILITDIATSRVTVDYIQ